ncbi:MAG: hypothetical protein KC621_05420 [Myxococcales bacterium]|nr:hypothetical protein [Myxococcales bacterium]
MWQGTGGEPVRLHLASVSESSVIFEGGASTFPARVEYVKTADGVRVDRSGTLQGEPFTMNWTYIPRRATPPWAEKGPDTP